MSYFRLQFLPFVIVGLVVGTTCLTFYLSFEAKHVTYLWPYMSDTGTFPPESCIFGQALNIVSFLLAFAMYIKYMQVQEIYQKHHIEEKYNLNNVALFVGVLACVGISLVANFQETNVFSVHFSGAVLAFGGGSIYESLQTLMYIKISPVIGQRKTTMFRIILSVVSLVSFLVFLVTAFIAYGEFKGNDVTKWTEQDGGYGTHQISTIAEWICASGAMVFILLFQTEFSNVTLKPMSVILDEHKSTHSDVATDY